MLTCARRWFTVFKDHTWPWKSNFYTKDLLSLNVAFMKVNAQWPYSLKKILPGRWIIFRKYLNFCYFLFATFLAFHICVLEFKTFLILMNSEEKEIMKISNSLIQSVIYSFTTVTTIYFRFNHKNLLNLFNFMNKNFKMRSALGLTYVTTEPTYYMARSVSSIWAVMITAGVVQLALYPLYIRKLVLPLNCWYPFDTTNNPHLWALAYAGQFLGQIQTSMAFVNVGVVLLSCIMLICGQFDILFCSLKNIRYTAMMMNNFRSNRAEKLQQDLKQIDEELNQYYYSYEQDENLNDTTIILQTLNDMQRVTKALKWKKTTSCRPEDTYLMEYNQELTEALHKCIYHHQLILETCILLEKFFNPIILVKSFQLTSQICNLAYVSSKKTPTLTETINNMEYLFLTLLELLLYGYAGEWLKQQSVRVGDALLRCPWHLCGGPFRRGILMLITNTRRPLVITGGTFFILDYDKMKAIIKASFSYYTLLNKLG